MIEYDDQLDDTEDGVIIWMAEAGLMHNTFSLSGRVSGWYPEDDDFDGQGISTFIPNPGFGEDINTSMVLSDQKITRFQGVVGYSLSEGVSIHAEGFFDDYDGITGKWSTDVLGGVIYLSALF